MRHWAAAPGTAEVDDGEATAPRLRVMSFNVLSETIRLQTAFLFSNVHDPRAAWPQRRPRVVAEVRAHGADVVGMQEVEPESGLLQDMQAIGYENAFVGRTGGKPDGCAMFWCAPAGTHLIMRWTEQLGAAELGEASGRQTAPSSSFMRARATSEKMAVTMMRGAPLSSRRWVQEEERAAVRRRRAHPDA